MIMTRDQIRDTVFASVSETFEFPLDEIREDMTAGDIGGWDSISTSYLIMDIEEKFDREFNIEEILNTENIGEMIEYFYKNL